MKRAEFNKLMSLCGFFSADASASFVFVKSFGSPISEVIAL
ncbi:MAG: hypothetical protein Q8930_12865 [Bacillota bacterium]|nr:hypothetical protein [Bacillota bacterium]